MICGAIIATLFSLLPSALALSIHNAVQKPVSLPYPSSLTSTASETCRQSPALFPSVHDGLDRSLEDLYNDEEFQLRAFEALSNVIRVPCVITRDHLGAFTDVDLSHIGR